MHETMTSEPIEAIAIIGFAGHFPGARNVDEYWRNLCDGVESISFFSQQELIAAGVNPDLLALPNFVRANAVLENAEMFDAHFFGFSPREVEIMDPQQRVFLECAWETFESAGYDAAGYDGPIGVYAGVDFSSYLFNLYTNPEIIESAGALQIMLGNDKDHLCTRVSHKLNLKGPSFTVQSACSTSLTAVHLACQGLLTYQCDMALAGGVSIKVPQLKGYLYQEGGIASPDGHCRAFDARANGTVAGNGVGLVLLKRLDVALADGDYIHAVIKGTAINNDGSQKISYTAPSVDGQAEVIAMAHAIAGVEAGSVTYVEAHGTATQLGDTIEIAALTQAFRAGTDKTGFCGVGSVKTNIGHLDAAAGAAGLIKTLLALKHKKLPPSLHFEEPNPHIDFANSPFYVVDKLTAWKNGRYPRRAGVSSYGMGGTNIHVILEEAPKVTASGASRPWQVLLLSAKTTSALEVLTANLAAHLKQHPEINLADIAFTQQVGRKSFDHRRMLVCREIDDALKALETVDAKRVFTAQQDAIVRPVVFMFTGQGSQYVNMGLELYQSEPSFRKEVDACANLLKPHLGFDLLKVLYPSEQERDEASRKLTQTYTTQPALFVVEYALARMLMSWGVEPQAMTGHSIGEYVAACLAGVFSLEDALQLVAARGRLMQQLPAGSMLAVSLSAKAVEPLLGGEVSLAASNSPKLCVVSGPDAAIEELQTRLTEQGAGYRRLHTSHAFHSAMMEPILEPFIREVKSVKLNSPARPYISNVTGTWITAAEATDPNYWAKHLRHTVRFTEAAAELLNEPGRVFLEVGPGQTLSTLVRQSAGKNKNLTILQTLPAPQETQPASAVMMNTLGRLWLAGVEINWNGFYEHEKRSRVPLPTYPFERQRFWVESQRAPDEGDARPRAAGKTPNIADWFYVPAWKQTAPLLRDTQDQAVSQDLCWLVFADACGLGEQIVDQLTEMKQQTVTVSMGEQFARTCDRSYTINPRQLSDYEQLLAELAERRLLPRMIYHLWSVSASHGSESGAGLFDDTQATGFYSLLYLAKALGRENITDIVQVGVVTNELQSLTGQEQTIPDKATIVGLCKVIPQEYLNVTCRSFDVSFPFSSPLEVRKLADRLITELVVERTDVVVAYRGNRRWVQTFEPMRLNELTESSTRLRAGGVYLITGGLGGVGMILAEHLALTVQAKLVLVGRSPFPAREEWTGWLESHDEADEVSRKIRKLQVFETAGAEVTVIRADVSDETQIQAAVAQIYEQHGVLHGVIHGAGINGERSVRAISEAGPIECGWHFQPKVYGLLALDKAIKGRQVDFCMLLSSLSAVLGGLGFAAYSAANLFMDAFAQKRRPTGSTPWITVNWDGWQLRELGPDTNLGAALNDLSMTPQEGLEAFHRILATHELSHVVVSTGDLQARLDQWIKPGSLRAALGAQRDPTATLYPRPEIKESYVAPATTLEQTLVGTWQELLGIEQIGINDNFFELGGHSLLATQVISRMRKLFEVELPLRSFFEAPTVADMATLIMRHQAEQVGDAQLLQMSEEIKQMSEEELRAMLETEKRLIATGVD
jgi:acyl transferase domain-containing protein